MIAAYAVSLHMLLSVFVAGQHAGLAAIAPDLASAICLTGSSSAHSDEPSGSPVSAASCVLCTIAASDAGTSHATSGVPQKYFGLGFAWVSTPVVAAGPPISPRLSQGPPQIA